MKNLLLSLLFFGLCASAQIQPIGVATNVVFAHGDIPFWSGSEWILLNKGTNGQVLTVSGTNVEWTTPATGGGSGTVTSVGAASTVSGLAFSNSPVTSSGTLTLTGTVAAASIDSAIARLASPALTGSPTAPTASPGTSNTVLATTAFVLQNAGPGGGGDVYLANSQTFTGSSNTFNNALRVYGEFYTATQTVDQLNIGSLSLGTNIVAITNGGTGATTASAARTALGAVDADNLTSGTVAEARVSSSIARLASPTFTGSPAAPTASAATSNTVIATTAYVDRAVASGGGGGGSGTTDAIPRLWLPTFGRGVVRGEVAVRDSAAFANFGDAVSAVGAAGSSLTVSSNAPIGIRYRATAASTSIGAVQASAMMRSEWLTTNAFYFAFGGGGSTSNRVHIGWYSASPVLSDTPATGYGLRYSGAGGAGDTNWRFISNDGSTTNNVDTGVAYTDGAILFATFVRSTTTNVVAYINGTAVGTNSFAPSGTSLLWYLAGRTLNTNTNDVSLYRLGWEAVIP